MTRERRKWSAQEDANLREAVQKESAEPHTFRWREVAKSVPGRTNKDCRKRWCNVLDTGINKGTWSESEDERLVEAVAEHGSQWTLVAQRVGTRGSDQCASHWAQVLNPNIDYSDWKKEEDLAILHGYNEFGRNWVKITNTYLPRRTTLMVKNRYTSFKSSKRAVVGSSQSSSNASTKNTSPARASEQARGNGADEADGEDDKDEGDDDDDDDDGNEDDDSESERRMSSIIDSHNMTPMTLDPLLQPGLYSSDPGLLSYQGTSRQLDILNPELVTPGYHNMPAPTPSGSLGSQSSGWMPPFCSSQPPAVLPSTSMTSTVSSIDSQSTLTQEMHMVKHNHSAQKGPAVGHDYSPDILGIRDEQMMDISGSAWDSASSHTLAHSYTSSSQGSFPLTSASDTDEQLVHLTVDIKCLASKVDPILSTIFHLSESMSLEKKYLSSHV